MNGYKLIKCIFLQLSLLDVAFLPPPLYVGAVRSRGNCAPVMQPDTGGVRRRRCFMSSPTLCRFLVECPPIWTNLPSWESPSASCGYESSSRLVRPLPGHLSWRTKLQICPAIGDQCVYNLNRFRLVLRFSVGIKNRLLTFTFISCSQWQWKKGVWRGRSDGQLLPSDLGWIHHGVDWGRRHDLPDGERQQVHWHRAGTQSQKSLWIYRVTTSKSYSTNKVKNYSLYWAQVFFLMMHQ